MTEHEPPGRALDVLVHRALWPDADIVDKPGYEGFLIDHPTGASWKEWRAIPRYSTDLMAWDWSREGWSWDREECIDLTIYLSVYEPLKRRKDCEASVPFNYDHPLAAEAFARSLCVLKWAEERGASDGH